MNLHELMFESGRYRLLRHLIFWMAWILFSATVQLTTLRSGPIALADLAIYQLLRALTRLPSHILFCYVTIYFFVPKFILKRKYKQFILYFSLFLFGLYWFNYFVLTPIYHLPGVILGLPFNQVPLPLFIRKFYSFYSNINFTGAVPACSLMLAIKYYKDWHKKQTEGEILIRENKQAELQLLKAQIHPHFLFNTLNNIYSFTITGSPEAAALVDKLSGMIDYITTEGEKSFVPVEKEIQLMYDYIGLEKVRYGDRLDMQVEINGDYKNKMIAPLLMIPFVENCFKHGTSQMRGRQWIKLIIDIKEDQLDFNLTNSKPSQHVYSKSKNGIGLLNVKKRLALLYPDKHQLIISSNDGVYSVHLQIELQTQMATEEKRRFTTSPILTYS